MTHAKLQALAAEVAGQLKTPEDISQLTQLLTKTALEAALNAELDAHWDNLNTLFRYPEAIRKAIYTTNAIESLNSVVRKAVKKRKCFPNDKAALKVVYLATLHAMPPKNGRCPSATGKRP